jgi:hypothetical protein
MIDSVVTLLGCSHDLAYSIMCGHLKFQKVCARCMPRELKDGAKINRMGLSLQHLLYYTDEREDMLNRIVTGNESWVHHCQSKSKRASMQWKYPILCRCTTISNMYVRYTEIFCQ